MGSPSDRQPDPATGTTAVETRRYRLRRVFIKKLIDTISNAERSAFPLTGPGFQQSHPRFFPRATDPHQAPGLPFPLRPVENAPSP
jgi:hypothetical protein